MGEAIERIRRSLAGVSADAAIESSIVHSWPWPIWLAVVILLLAGLVAFWLYRAECGNRRTPRNVLFVLRWSQITIIVFMLFGWLWRSYRTELPDVVLMLDTSASMLTVDPYSDARLKSVVSSLSPRNPLPTRLELSRRLLLRDDSHMLRSLAARYRLRLFFVDESWREVTGEVMELAQRVQDAQSDGPASRLGVCLQELLDQQRGRSTAAIIFLSDGITTEGRTVSESAELARQKGVPLFIVGIGDEQPPRDVALTDVIVDDVAFVDDLLTFDGRIRHDGFAGKTIVVRLRQIGDDRVLDEQTMTLGTSSESQSIRLAHRPQTAGDFEYRVELVVPTGDMVSQNDSVLRRVSVRNETIRVLFVQAYPSPEFQFVKRLLSGSVKPITPLGSKDPTQGDAPRAIELRTVLQDADSEFSEQDETALRTFPPTREDLFEYDVLIFGDVMPDLLSRSALVNIRDFVQVRGGGMVVLAGPLYTPQAYVQTPLAECLPIRPESLRVPSPNAVFTTGFKVRPSLLGLASSHLQLGDAPAANSTAWEKLAELYWLAEAGQLRPGARTLLEHPDKVLENGEPLPVVCMQFVGAGKVIFHATDESYRWSRGEAGSAPYNQYWLQTIRYLSRSKLLGGNRVAELSSDRNEFRPGEAVHLRIRFFDERFAPHGVDDVTVVLEQPAAAQRQVVLRRQATDRAMFETSVSALPSGDYRAWLASPTLDGPPPSHRFVISAQNSEMLRLQMNKTDLIKAAKTSSGKFYQLPEANRLLNELPLGNPIRMEPLPAKPLWNSPWLATLFISLLATEWLLRKKWGLA